MLYVSLTVSETTLTRVWSFYRIYVQATDPHYGTETISSSPKWSKPWSLRCRGCCYWKTARYWVLWISGRGMMSSNMSGNLARVGSYGVSSYNCLIILIGWSQWLDMCWKEDPQGFTWCWKCWCWRHCWKVHAGVSADGWLSSPQHHTVPGCVFPPPTSNCLCCWWRDSMAAWIIC